MIFCYLPISWLNLKYAKLAFSKAWAKGVFLIIGKKFHVKGKENIRKENRYILVANHASLFDIMAIMSFYPGVSWFGHERLLKVPLFGMILKMLNYIPFKTPTVKNTKQMLSQMAMKSKTETIAIFPEGTRTLNGKINPFFKGFIYLFRTSDIEILPVTLNGFYNLKPKNRSYINFNSKLEVVIHKPLKRLDLLDKSDDEIMDTVKSVIESAYLK
jgi:1-acyl-sn-glycerol-3-phosphate acyltransferase